MVVILQDSGHHFGSKYIKDNVLSSIVTNDQKADKRLAGLV